MNILKHIVIEHTSINIDDKNIFSYQSENLNFADFAKKIYYSLNINYPKFFKMSDMCKLGFIASEMLLQNTDLSKVNKNNVALVFSSSSASINADIEYQKTISNIPSPALFVYTLPNIITGEICIRNGFKGEEIMLIQKQYDADFLFDYADILFKEKNTELCLAGFINFDENNEYIADMYLLKNNN